MQTIGYISAKSKNGDDRAFHMINYSGYNIGTFAMPYLQSFLGNSGIITACLFDSGNAVILKSILKVLVVRYGTAACLAAALYYFLPFTQEIKIILVIIVFAPISSMGVINTERIKGDTGRAGMINSMSILISLAVMTGLVCVWKLGQ
ncbi:hypothetical protein LAD12857_48410 [Lacrimispora amygdalina]|uniref:Uncharacterized protein n=1 Tax=Lacrimispora amygdalina TaxID=253257 RepID=A0A3E2N5B0_9FIRM|nr:hypothetical protein [Clostridium indicum]RFZ76162.1 hypothetical protein DS742_25165 [Clostridium indicum]